MKWVFFKVFVVDLLLENQNLFAGSLVAYEMGVTIFNELSITYQVKLIYFPGRFRA